MSTTLMPCNGPMVRFAPDLLSGSSNGRAQPRSSPVGVWGHARGRARMGNFRAEDNDAQEFDATFAEKPRRTSAVSTRTPLLSRRDDVRNCQLKAQGKRIIFARRTGPPKSA